MQRWLIGGLLLVVVGGGLWFVRVNGNQPDQARTGSVPLETDVSTATLHSPTGDPNATGVATRQFVDVVFVHGITANLPELPAGQFYAGWLVRAADLANPLATGKLVKDASSWSLSYSSPVDQRAFDGVLVTVQTGESQAPGATVLEGTFLK